MRTTEKMTITKSYKVATMEGAKVKFVGKKLSGTALVDLQSAHIWKYGSTAEKYLNKLNARARLNAEGKDRMRNKFYLVEGAF